MSLLDIDLRSDLEQQLDEEELAGFEAGELALFIKEPKEAFFQFSDSDLYRADVVRDLSPEGDADRRVIHVIHQTAVGDLRRALRRQDDLETYSARIIFGP